MFRKKSDQKSGGGTSKNASSSKPPSSGRTSPLVGKKSNLGEVPLLNSQISGGSSHSGGHGGGGMTSLGLAGEDGGTTGTSSEDLIVS